VKDLCDKLDKVIFPLFYDNRKGRIRVMKNSIGNNAYFPNTHAMMQPFITEAYLG